MTEPRWIRPLPERVINKIAAGEVIERPAAVVKELVENAIDAGADRIDIVIEKSGTKLIKIVDNGCGIPEEQVEVAFSRHATSKITGFDDLNALYSYGFRGEALPSIASISRMRMVTRTREAKLGTEIIYEGGVLQSRQPVSAPPGTLIEVEDLFFNTPARRKFLKAESTEARHISRTAMALALGRADIGFSYSLNGRKIFTAPPDSSLQERVAQILGQDKKYVAIEGEMGPVKLQGYVGTPDNIQNNRYGQFLFINSRFIQSASLSHAFSAGYGELIARGSFPVGALLLTIDVTDVDVNVHPTKAEVRLSNEREVHDAVYRIIKETLQQDAIIPSLRRPESTAPPVTGPAESTADAHGRAGQAFIPGIHQTGGADSKSFADFYKGASADPSSPGIVRVDKATGEVLDDLDTTVSAEFQLIGRFSNLYLVLQSGDSLYIVDQHTAHERVLYEETLAKMDEAGLEAQTLLFPVQVELNAQQFALFDEVADLLNRSGFKVSHFGGTMINIEAVPSILSRKSPEKLLARILDDILSEKKAGHDLRKSMAQSIACRSAVMAGDRLSDQEASYLVEQLLKCENRYSCPHGRPTFVKISRQDLDKQFGRL